MAEIPTYEGLAVAAIMFALGLVGVLVRRNLVFVLICIEVMLNAAGLAFVLAGQRWGQADGQIMYILMLTVAGGGASVGLALMLRVSQRFETLDTEAVREMRG